MAKRPDKSDLGSQMLDVGSGWPDQGSWRSDLESMWSNFGSERSDFGSERPDFGSGRPDLMSEKPDFGSERSDLVSKRPDLGSERLYLRLGGGDGRKPEKIALCGIIGHRPLRGRCPKGEVESRTPMTGKRQCLREGLTDAGMASVTQ